MSIPTSTQIRIVIADDHEMLREGFHNMLKKQTDIRLVGEAADGKELIDVVEKQKPDVVITDIKMPGMDGIQATRAILKKFPDIGIIALTLYDEDNLIIDMLEAGAKGYLTKTASKPEVLEAIHAVYKQNTFYCKHTSARLIQLIAKSRFNPNKKTTQPQFNEREVEIIRLICKEYTSKEIAQATGLSVRTVEGYREKIQEKMKVKNMVGIAIYAIRKGIG